MELVVLSLDDDLAFEIIVDLKALNDKLNNFNGVLNRLYNMMEN